MTGPVLVTGGTGTLGRLVTARLRHAGRAVRVLSRQERPGSDGVEFVTGDLAGGGGIESAVEGAATIVHCAGGPKGDDVLARNLVRAASGAGRPHLVFISVVGADRIPVVSRTDRLMYGYFGFKGAAERIVADSGLPFSTLRATQFHDLVLTMAQQLTRLPLVPAPALQFQPIEADEVAERLTELALAEPAGLVPDMGGPRAYPVADLIRSYLRASHRHRLLVPVRQPGRAARALRDGANLTLDHAVGRRTWEEFLAEKLGRRPGS